MNVFQAIGGALGDAHWFVKHKNYAEMHGVLNSLGTALRDWLPHNDGYFFNTNLLVDDSEPGRLVFETRTAAPSAQAMSREYRTVVKAHPEDPMSVMVATIQTKGLSIPPGERAEVLGAIESKFAEAMLKTLGDDDDEGVSHE